MKSPGFKFDCHKAAELPVVKKKINIMIVSESIHMILVSDKCKFFTERQNEILDIMKRLEIYPNAYYKIDLPDRSVVASVSDRNITSDLAIRTAKKALASQKSIESGLIFHSD